MKKLSNKFRKGALNTTIIFLVSSVGIALQLERLNQSFKFQSISILAIRCNGWQETVSVPKYSLQ